MKGRGFSWGLTAWMVGLMGCTPPAQMGQAVDYPTVRVEAGRFEMGSSSLLDAPPHPVVITRPLMVGKTPLTIGQYQKVMGLVSEETAQENLPKGGLSWYEAIEVANRLSELNGLAPCYEVEKRSFGRTPRVTWPTGLNCSGYRLPTEAEWEYFARGGTTSRFWSGETEADLARVGFYHGNSGSSAHPVGSLPPNPWGLFDIHGNVYQWCWDMGESVYPSVEETDPIGSTVGSSHSRRGGWWGGSAAQSEVARRDRYPTNEHFEGNGVRLVRTTGVAQDFHK